MKSILTALKWPLKVAGGILALLSAWMLYQRYEAKGRSVARHQRTAAMAEGHSRVTRVNAERAAAAREKARSSATKASEIRRQAERRIAVANAAGLEKPGKKLRERFDAF